MRYDKVFERLANRAVKQGIIDLEAFIGQMQDNGASADVIEGMLFDDLENNGAIFGKFFRSLGGASEASVATAFRQGENVGTILDLDKELADYVNENKELMQALDDGNPETLEQLEKEAQDWRETWVAELVNTCERCLPLHGKTMFHSQWLELGLTPDTIHEGWTSSCHCRMVPLGDNDSQEVKQELVAPLVRIRQKTETGLKLSKRTARSVTAYDMERAQQAVKQASESLEGRRTLRMLGKVSG